MALGPKKSLRWTFSWPQWVDYSIGQPLDIENYVSLIRLVVWEQKGCERNFLGCVNEH